MKLLWLSLGRLMKENYFSPEMKKFYRLQNYFLFNGNGLNEL